MSCCNLIEISAYMDERNVKARRDHDVPGFIHATRMDLYRVEYLLAVDIGVPELDAMVNRQGLDWKPETRKRLFKLTGRESGIVVQEDETSESRREVRGTVTGS